MLRGSYGHRRYSITHRAVQRLRELVSTMEELDDETLRDRLDRALGKAEDEGRAVCTLDAMLGEPQVLIPLTEFGETLYAIIKEDTVVTVLPHGHGEEILQRGKALEERVASGEIVMPDRDADPRERREAVRRANWRRDQDPAAAGATSADGPRESNSNGEAPREATRSSEPVRESSSREIGREITRELNRESPRSEWKRESGRSEPTREIARDSGRDGARELLRENARGESSRESQPRDLGADRDSVRGEAPGGQTVVVVQRGQRSLSFNNGSSNGAAPSSSSTSPGSTLNGRLGSSPAKPANRSSSGGYVSRNHDSSGGDHGTGPILRTRRSRPTPVAQLPLGSDQPEAPQKDRPGDAVGATLFDALESAEREATRAVLREMLDEAERDTPILPLWIALRERGLPDTITVSDLIAACQGLPEQAQAAPDAAE